jgi:Ca2+-binding EF-hand superfamily protein
MQKNLKDLLALRIPLGLSNIPAETIVGKLKSHFNSNSKKSFPREKFVEFIKSLDADDNLNDDELTQHCNTLFNGLDFDANGKLSRTEIANFLILVSKGNKQDKIEAAFDLYDRNGNNKLDMGELTDYFLGVIKLSMMG